MTMKINFNELMQQCNRRNAHSPCDCPEVLYSNEDGICRHLVCEGDLSAECGEIVGLEPNDTHNNKSA